MDDLAITPDAAEQGPSPDELAVREERLSALGVSLAESRSKAITGRKACGIEDQWQQDEEYYEGIDDANRQSANWRSKPPGQVAQADADKEATRSRVFINITRPYVDSAAARVSDMLLPTDDRSWSIKPTPMPELMNMANGSFPPAVLRQAAAAYPGQPDQAKEQLFKAVDQARADIEDAKVKADDAQKQIDDWLVECQYHAENRLVIEDCTKVGTGILKGPVPTKARQVAFVNNQLVLRNEIQPQSRRIDYWNFFPDPDCGENIHNGNYTWERDELSKKILRELKGGPGYLDDQIEAVLQEGPMKASGEAPKRPIPEGHVPDQGGSYEIWYFTGMLEREHLELCGVKCPEGNTDLAIPVQVEMVNNRIIKALLNPIDTGDFPYDIMIWQRKVGNWAGIGVSRQIRTPQEIVVGAGRALMDNAGIGSGPQVVVQQGVVIPHDGVYEITPWKIWLAGSDADMESIDKAFRFVTVPMAQVELNNIIQLGLKLAEDVTGLPMLMQGQMGSAPDTLGGQQMAMNNASATLRRIARTYDDRLTEPHIRRYYRYILIHGEDHYKGDFQIDASGSSALIQRDIENQAVAEMGKIVANPIFGVDPRKWMAEYLKAKHLDPKKFAYDDQHWQEIVANLQKGASDPRLAVAELRAVTEQKLLALKLAFEESEATRSREHELMLAAIDVELAKEGLNVEQRKTLETIKGKLSDSIIKLRAQREMQMAEHSHNRTSEVLKPAAEPLGRAAPGKSFTH